jgi:hypothetical protein
MKNDIHPCNPFRRGVLQATQLDVPCAKADGDLANDAS